MFEPIVNYLAGEYVTNNNSDISDCIYDTVTDDNFEKCNLGPMETHLTINKKMYKKFNEYKKKAEKFEADYTNFIKDIEKMVLISDKIKNYYKTLTTNGKKKRFLVEQIEQAPLRFEEMAKKYYLLRSQTFKGPRMNGGIFRSPNDEHLLGLMIIPYKVEYDKYKYPKLNITTEKTGFINKQNTAGDYNYGIGVIGKDFKTVVDNSVKAEFNNIAENNHYFPLEDTEAPKESFINIPKKSNGLMYVILFILAVFLFRKLKK
tara:strand:+ start:1018 stop:1800 length:783 start_codon:yes stop_codon:yes gene_type:complete